MRFLFSFLVLISALSICSLSATPRDDIEVIMTKVLWSQPLSKQDVDFLWHLQHLSFSPDHRLRPLLKELSATLSKYHSPRREVNSEHNDALYKVLLKLHDQIV